MFLNCCYWRLLVFMFFFFLSFTGMILAFRAKVQQSFLPLVLLRGPCLLLMLFIVQRDPKIVNVWLVDVIVTLYFFKYVMLILFVCPWSCVFSLDMSMHFPADVGLFMYLGLTFKRTFWLNWWVLHYRNLSTSALMERMPSKWPRPVWHAPWKNYRVQTSTLFLVVLNI